jgi:hypothetical protein
MHIKFNRALRGDYGRARVGDVKLVSAAIGKSLINRGLAVEVDKPADEPADEATETEAPAETATEGKGRKPASK